LAAIIALEQGSSPEVLIEQGSRVVYMLELAKIVSVVSSSGIATGNKAWSWAAVKCLALVRALASACVFPGNSLENPVESTMVDDEVGHLVVITHPTQNAVGVGSHLRASSKARKRKSICSICRLK